MSLVGVPFNSAARRGGVANAPAALRRAGLAEALRRVVDVRDAGDVSFADPTPERDPASGILALASLASMIRNVRTSVRRVLAAGGFPVVVGGDCAVLLGCLAAIEAAPPALVFVDGHEDAYPADRSPTGEASDMELGFALGLDVPDRVRRAMGSARLLDASRVCVLGPRDKEVLVRMGVRSLDDGSLPFYDDRAIRAGDIEAIARAAVRKVTSATRTLWLHVDLDVLSTGSLSAVDYRQPGGLSWRQLERLTAAVLSSASITGMSVTIYNPDLDPRGRGGRRIVTYLETVTASRAEGPRRRRATGGSA